MTSASTLERQPLQPDFEPPYKYLSIENIEALRDSQRERQHAMLADAYTKPNIPESVRKTETELHASSDSDAETYLAQYMNRDDNPERFDALQKLLSGVSYYHMNGVEWNLGNSDADGKHSKLETSGRSQYEEALQTLFDSTADSNDTLLADPDTQQDNNPTTPDHARTPVDREQLARLREARTAFAKLSIARRQKINSGGNSAEALEAEYREAQENYEQLVVAIGGSKVQALRELGVSEDELKAVTVTSLLDEHQAFSKIEQQILEAQHPRLKKVAKLLARKYHLEGASAVAGAAVGFIGKWALRAVAGVAVGASGGAAIGAGLALKSTKAVLMAKVGRKLDTIRHFDERRDIDTKSLTYAAAEKFDHLDHDDYVTAANDLLQHTIDRRIELDRKANARRVGRAAVFGLVGGLAGVGIASAAEHLGWITKPGSSGHHPAGTGKQPPSGRGTTTPPGGNGSSGITPPPETGSGSIDSTTVDGYNSHVSIGSGDGYQHVYHNLLSQKGISLTGNQEWELAHHLDTKFNGHILHNLASYRLNDDYGISATGNTTVNPAVIHEMQRWLTERDLDKATS